MEIRKNATLAIPLLLIAAGLAVPLCLGTGPRGPVPAEVVEQARYAGKTAAEWRGLAEKATAESAFAKALKYWKTAERVEPGSQYGPEIALARQRHRRVREIGANRERFRASTREVGTDGLGPAGERRAIVVRPGESLWTLSELVVAAERGLLPDELPGRDAEVYGLWDSLTDLYGVRELAVGETIGIPVTAEGSASPIVGPPGGLDCAAR
jgi:hypothetical protein